jgi:hypothetical protein
MVMPLQLSGNDIPGWSKVNYGMGNAIHQLLLPDLMHHFRNAETRCAFFFWPHPGARLHSIPYQSWITPISFSAVFLIPQPTMDLSGEGAIFLLQLTP